MQRDSELIYIWDSSQIVKNVLHLFTNFEDC